MMAGSGTGNTATARRAQRDRYDDKGAVPRLRAGITILMLLVAAGMAPGLRAETVVYGRVLAVEPIGGSPGAEPTAVDCAESAPPRAAGLMARLRWDLERRDRLRAHCHAAQAPARFRVTYRWNGQLFTQELPFDPGERIALRLDVR